MLWCWFTRKMAIYIFAQTFSISMPTQRRILIHCQGSKRHLKLWLVLAISCACTWSLDSGKSRWMNHQSSTLHLLFVNLGFFECNCMPFGLCNVPATFQRLMQICLRELNLAYCLIYLNDIIIFSWMAEEHLHHLCIIFDWFREHNLKMKPFKCDFFRDEINYLAHWVSKDSVHPSNMNLKVIAECIPMQTYMEMHSFLSLVGHYQRFIKGFTCITQPLSMYFTGEGASRMLKWVSLTEEAMRAFEELKQACMMAPILVFADYTKPFLLETDACKDELGAVLLQSQADRQYHLIAYGSKALTPHKKNYHSTKLEFLALKWAVTEHFKEYLPYQSSVVWMENNPLMYIMSTPNLDAMGHQWVGALAQFNFKLEYQKGHDNIVEDILSQVTTWLDPETVKSILDGVTLGTVHRAKIHDPAMVEGDQCLEQEVCITAGFPLVEMHVTNWAKAQREDPMLRAVLDWLKVQKQTDLKILLAVHTFSEEGNLILHNWQNFMIHQEALYLHSTPKGETENLLLFMVPKVHCAAILNGCHWDAGHQGHDWTL